MIFFLDNKDIQTPFSYICSYCHIKHSNLNILHFFIVNVHIMHSLTIKRMKGKRKKSNNGKERREYDGDS